MDSYKMEHPMYEFLCEKKTHYKTLFSPYTHGMIDIQELRLYAYSRSFFIKWSLCFTHFQDCQAPRPTFPLTPSHV